jgi:hypothetical protein
MESYEFAVSELVKGLDSGIVERHGSALCGLARKPRMVTDLVVAGRWASDSEPSTKWASEVISSLGQPGRSRVSKISLTANSYPVFALGPWALSLPKRSTSGACLANKTSARAGSVADRACSGPTMRLGKDPRQSPAALDSAP